MAQNLTYLGFTITVSDNCVTVFDSYKTTKRSLIKEVLSYVASKAPNNVIQHRSINSLCNEWIAHTRLYNMGIAKSHTRNVDMEYPISTLHSLAWTILGSI